ncbi:MAG TPA: hypothetical protein VF809_01005, partial [Candidatus Saccharimonadales bacterium]
RAEAMLKGTPSSSSNRGGLPMQGQDGEGGGHVIDLDNLDSELDRLADEIVADSRDPQRYEARRAAAKEWAESYIRPELTTVANVIRFSRIADGRGGREWSVRDMAKARQKRIAARGPVGSAALTGEEIAA